MTETELIFRQLFHSGSSTFTYLLGCSTTKEAVLIDPVDECVQRDLKLVNELGLHLVYGINTHIHADHVTGTGEIKGTLKDLKSVLGSKTGGKADRYVNQDEEISFGNLKLQCRSTPGHTNGCMTYVLHSHKMAFTGDAVLIRGCGRTDFQQGSASTLYDSVHSQIFSLPANYRIYPAHDYKGFNVTTVDEEMKFNARLTKSKEEFIDIMNNLNLSMPKKIKEAVPANLNCGFQS